MGWGETSRMQPGTLVIGLLIGILRSVYEVLRNYARASGSILLHCEHYREKHTPSHW